MREHTLNFERIISAHYTARLHRVLSNIRGVNREDPSKPHAQLEMFLISQTYVRAGYRERRAYAFRALIHEGCSGSPPRQYTRHPSRRFSNPKAGEDLQIAKQPRLP